MVELQIVDAAMRKQDSSSIKKLNTNSDITIVNSDHTTVDVASIYDPIRRLPENVLIAPPTPFRRRLLRPSFSNS